MSAYVVEDKVINQVISWIVTPRRDGDPIFEIILKETGHDLRTKNGRAALGKAMFELNCTAVEQRYGDKSASDFRPLNYRYIDQESLGGGLIIMGTPVTSVQAYKSLACWDYQCSEGDVPDTPLYKAMARVACEMAHIIVRSLPAWEQAAW